MSVEVKKIEGVSNIEVSLSKGTATIQLKPSNKVTLEEIRKAVESKGLTPKDATVRLKGQLKIENGELIIKIPGTQESWNIGHVKSDTKSKDQLEKLVNDNLNFVALIPSKIEKTQPAVTVLDFWK